ncbi:type IV pilus biogenesis protein PilM [Clostridium rectalis]|uniref:type IV pilus biogenesis protein PilM n=1 Tax=Clostridium rectalis TaxID=2040295 RepID=UPI000F63D0CC|nr:hypothetical protein [Clostridium rectalis]
MLWKKRVIYRFSDDILDIVIINKNLGKVTFNKVEKIDIGDNTSMDVDSFIEENKIRNINSLVILNLEGIIVRSIKVPFLKKKELKKFIYNNINEYFTVNIDEYYYDYKILKIDKNESIDIFLVVVPKEKFQHIYSLIKEWEINIDKITIYAECIYNIFSKFDTSSAFLDIINNKSNITISNKKELFLYSRSDIDLTEEKLEIYGELVENISYFLNFYSTRHFGNRVDKLYIGSELYKNQEFIGYIKNQLNIELVCGLNDIYEGIVKENYIDLNDFADVLGGLLNSNKLKSIDFNKVIENERTKDRDMFSIIAVSLAILSVTWFFLGILYMRIKLQKYDCTVLDKNLSSMKKIEGLYKEEKTRNEEYKEMGKAIKAIEEDKVDYIYYLDSLKKGMPSDMQIIEVNLDKDKVNLKARLNQSGDKVLDKINLVVALNKLNIFEPIDMEYIKLDGSEKDVEINLVIK